MYQDRKSRQIIRALAKGPSKPRHLLVDSQGSVSGEKATKSGFTWFTNIRRVSGPISPGKRSGAQFSVAHSPLTQVCSGMGGVNKEMVGHGECPLPSPWFMAEPQQLRGSKFGSEVREELSWRGNLPGLSPTGGVLCGGFSTDRQSAATVCPSISPHLGKEEEE